MLNCNAMLLKLTSRMRMIKNRLKTITKTLLLDILIELSPLSLDWISDAHN